jgi:hypothetical protein
MRLTAPTTDLIETDTGAPARTRACARRVALVAAMFALAAAGPALAAGKVYVQLWGPSIYADGAVSDSGAEAVAVRSYAETNGRTWRGFARAAKSEATDELSVYAGISGTSTANGSAEASNGAIRYVLRPPEGARFDAGKLVVYGGIGDADISGGASLRFVLDVEAKFANGESRPKWAEGTLKERPGGESLEFFVAVPLPAALDSTKDVDLVISTVYEAAARIEADAGGSEQAAWVFAEDAGRTITGFEVFDAAGKQVRGFAMTAAVSGLVIPERAPPKAGTARAIEFYHPQEQNFFVTANSEEIALLDGGAIDGWQRTGQWFDVYTQSVAGAVPICRFYADAFAPDFAHMYVASGTECDALRKNPDWKYEGIAFLMPLPAADGTCAAGHRPVYRLYNDGMDGAPSHRLTTRMLTRLEMIADDWTPEGAGPGVAMCSPL